MANEKETAVVSAEMLLKALKNTKRENPKEEK